MTFGLMLAVVVVVLFVGALCVESYRVGRVETWCRDQGFQRLDQASPDVIQRLRGLASHFRGESVWKWGLALEGAVSGGVVTIAECDVRLGPKRRYMFTLAAQVSPGANIGEIRLESTSQAADLLGRIVAIPLLPLIWLAEKAKAAPVTSPPVAFPEDPEFDRAFKVFGDEAAARTAFNTDLRHALVASGWTGQLVASGDTIVWRRKGFIFPSRVNRFVADAAVLQPLLDRPFAALEVPAQADQTPCPS
jgi:hypothetical protein